MFRIQDREKETIVKLGNSSNVLKRKKHSNRERQSKCKT